MNLDPPAGQPQWLFDRFRKIGNALDGAQTRPFTLANYTELPDPARYPGSLIYTPSVPMYSDGSEWKPVTMSRAKMRFLGQ